VSGKADALLSRGEIPQNTGIPHEEGLSRFSQYLQADLTQLTDEAEVAALKAPHHLSRALCNVPRSWSRSGESGNITTTSDRIGSQ
jgi:hypothetical protein